MRLSFGRFVSVFVTSSCTAKRNLRLPREVVLIGSGPLSEKEMRAILSAREIQAAPPEDPSTAVMIVGRDDWLVDDLEAQIRARGEVGLRVYSIHRLADQTQTRSP
jgi:hypothetical protein